MRLACLCRPVRLSYWRRAGRTDASGSSRGSSADGDAETVNLRGSRAETVNLRGLGAETVNLRGPGAGPAPASGAAGHEAAPADDPTVIVSRAPRPAFGRAFASSARSGPRRLGAHVLQCCFKQPQRQDIYMAKRVSMTSSYVSVFLAGMVAWQCP